MSSKEEDERMIQVERDQSIRGLQEMSTTYRERAPISSVELGANRFDQPAPVRVLRLDHGGQFLAGVASGFKRL